MRAAGTGSSALARDSADLRDIQPGQCEVCGLSGTDGGSDWTSHVRSAAEAGAEWRYGRDCYDAALSIWDGGRAAGGAFADAARQSSFSVQVGGREADDKSKQFAQSHLFGLDFRIQRC